ncbi:MAG: RNA polymerase sigma factor (sigma-70 family) [Flavobacteriaceae bacterium]|jgi:RNA polymerase sigma factor (sigma-70 family)
MNIANSHTSNIDDLLKDLYTKWPDVKLLMKKIGCSNSDAEDLFQEALLIFMRKMEDPTFELTVAPFHYVKNTCKLLWYNQARKEKKLPKSDLPEEVAQQDDDWFQNELLLQKVEKAISEIGQKCQDLLKLFYGLGQSMVDIAKKLGFRNDNVAKAQKYRCINKVKDILRSQESHSI